MQKVNSFIVPIIKGYHLGRFLETLYKFTPDNFYVIVIDQCVDDEAYLKYHDKVHLWIKSYRNLGYSKALNTGLRLVQTPYVTFANDDIEFLDNRWWQGIEDTFATDEKIVGVNPMSPREGAFGYGLQAENTTTWVPPKGFVRDGEFVVPELPDGTGMTYKGSISKEQYDWLLNSHPRWGKDTLCDGICMWCTTFKTQWLQEAGPMDERFYPGNGEDYDMNGRAYSCAWPEPREVCDPSEHRRLVATTKSWVWHWWGESKAHAGKLPHYSRDNWNRLDQLWPNGFDSWGHQNMPDGSKKPYKRIPEVFIDEL